MMIKITILKVLNLKYFFKNRIKIKILINKNH